MARQGFDLEERTERFAAEVRGFVRRLPRTIANIEDVKQPVRSSGSVGANCIEANEALGTRDRIMRFKICRKEAKESAMWLRVLNRGEDREVIQRGDDLVREATELKLIFTAIIKRLEVS
jgi:four helix bundle protein